MVITAVSCTPPSSHTNILPTLVPTANLTLIASLPSPEPATSPTTTATPTQTAAPLPTETSTATVTATTTPTQTNTPLPTETSTATATATLPPPTATNTVPPQPTATAVPATNTPIPPTTPPQPAPSGSSYHIPQTPGNPQPYLSQFRLVTYYGSPLGWGLGILGESSRSQMTRALRETAAAYIPYSAGRTVLPTYHMVVLVANPHPPSYFHRVDMAVLEEWIAAAEAEEIAVILDMQPGRGDIMAEFYRLRPLLYHPHVHLAIDPEFTMNDEQIPGQNIGQLYAATINAVQAELEQIAIEIGVNRVLIVHQFLDRMLPDKEAIVNYPHVELVIDGDGVGANRVKIENYLQYASEPGFEYGGFKLFPTDGDYPVMSPNDVMTQLAPPPVIIIYQ